MNTRRQPYEIQNRRGMILLLVVAVLVLLALMGTVYILSASTDKQVSYASNDQANLNYATQGMLSIVRADILNTTLGPGGVPLALGSTTPARVWTGPDLGYVSNGAIGEPAGGTFERRLEDFAGTVSAPTPPSGQRIASQPWLCGAMPVEPNTTYAPGTTLMMVSAPSIRPLRTVPTLSEEVSGGGAPVPRPYGAYTPLISYLTPYLYDPEDGQYDLGYNSMQLGTASGATIDVPNASVVMPGSRYDSAEAETGNNPLIPLGTLDAMWNLLPYSSPNGTHYRFAVRIMDTSAMMNVNTGWIAADTSSPQPSPNNPYYVDAGAAMAAYPLYAVPGTYNTSDNPSTMQAANQTPRTRAGTYNPQYYDLLDWQNALANYEAQGMPYTTTATTGASGAGSNTWHLSLYGAGTELQWLSYGGAGGQFGLLAPNRLSSQTPGAPQMPGTFGTGANGYGTGYQDFYTTYSWSRQYASAQATNAPQSLVAGATSLYPSRVDLNAGNVTAGNEYTLAAQISNALETCGYNQIHACEYAANYFSYRYGVGGTSSEPAVLTSGSLTDPVIGASAASTGKLPVGAGTYFIGNTAQPFINEMEVTLKFSGSGAPNVTGYGIELKNPYVTTTAMSLSGWQVLVLNSSGGVAVTIPLTNQTVGAYGTGACFLTAYSGSTPPIAGGTKVAGPPASGFPTAGTIILTRPCNGAPADGAVAAGNAIVDAMNYSIGPPNGANPTGPYYVDASRENGEWGCDSGTAATIKLTPQQSPAGITLGATNTPGSGVATVASGAPCVPLYDRFADGDPVASGFDPTNANYQILNWADANCIARECSMESPGATNGPTFEPVSWQIGANRPQTIPSVTGYTPIANEGYLFDVYFDFPFDSRAALTSVDMPTSGVVEPNVLTMFSLNARADNPTVTPVGLAYPSLLTRTPGLINVNTAGEVPLYDAVYDAADSVAGITKGPVFDSQLVADTIAYRDRLEAQSNFPIFSSTSGTGTSAATVTATGTTPAYDTYPGYNIKSLGDLLLAWLPELETISPNPTSFLQRDILWADCANNFCVHSDSFAVYGLVQAIRLNPNYVSNGGAPNAADWYRASQETSYNHIVSSYGVYLAPRLVASTSSVTAGIGTASKTIIPEFILEGQRRFVAIVDSSYSTPLGGSGTPPAPKIVAMKILPQ